jgi:hypothetical protein
MPRLDTLLLLHGLHDVSLSQGQLNLRARNGLNVQRILKAQYWIETHDEAKIGGGIVSWFLKLKIFTLEEAMALEKAKELETAGNAEVGEWERRKRRRFYLRIWRMGQSLLLN